MGEATARSGRRHRARPENVARRMGPPHRVLRRVPEQRTTLYRRPRTKCTGPDGNDGMIGSRFAQNKGLPFDERLDPASTALVVIDVQNDFAIPQGVCGQVGDDISPVAPMLEKLAALIESARQAQLLIVFVRTTYDEPVLSPALAEQ